MAALPSAYLRSPSFKGDDQINPLDLENKNVPISGNASSDDSSSLDQDAKQLASFGYRTQLARRWKMFESFAVSFCAMNFIGGTRSILFLGVLAGGSAAAWSSMAISWILMTITAAVLAEICSALPLSGSIYIWAAEAAGHKYARLVGFIVAWWTCTAWMTFSAGNCQTTANYILSLMVVFDVDYPGGVAISNVKFRVLVWIVSEGIFLLTIALNYLPPRAYSKVFKISMCIMMLDFVLCLIWLPIGVSRTYGFRSAKEVFTGQYNGTGAPSGWNWLLSFLYAAGVITGFDASGHIAEETKNASKVAARGIVTSAFATGGCGLAATILFLFCVPDNETWFALYAPQPFVQIYAMALGKGGAVFMTILAALGLIMNTSIAIVAASRLIFAVARDGVLPFSGWISQVTPDGRPKNAVTVMAIFGSLILCTILPSNVAFTSLISAGGVPTIAAYALIAFCRFFFTPGKFTHTKFGLGKFAKPFYLIAFVWCCVVFAVDIAPFSYPTSGATFNYSPVIFGSVTIFGIICWWIIPADQWLRKELVANMDHSVEQPEER